MFRTAFEHDHAVAILHVPMNMRPPKRIATTTPSISIESQMDDRMPVSHLAIMNSDSDIDIRNATRLTAEDEDIRGMILKYILGI